MKVAAFIAGDKNILNPSIIALKSLKKYNPKVSLYLLIDIENLTIQEKKLLEENEITIPEFNIEYDFTSSQNWPKEVFWNYKAPIIFHKLGFEYSLKIDLDTVCLKEIDWSQILPTKEVFAAVPTGYTVDTYLEKEREFLIQEFNLNIQRRKYIYPNVGVIVFNNQKYFQSEIWTKLYNYKNRIVDKSKSKSLDIIFADQALFAILLASSDNILWKKISMNYNYTLHDKKLANYFGDFFNKVVICHYTGPKPWKKISLFYLFYNPYLYYYRQVYFDYLKEINIFDKNLKINNYRENFKDKLVTKLIDSHLFKYWIRIWYKLNKYMEKI